MQRLVGLALPLVVTLTGCPPRKPPPPIVDPGLEPVVQATVVRSWAALPVDPYPELAAGPATVDSLRRTHDVGLWTPSRQRWGPLSVLQFEDTDRPQTAVGAVAAWVLGDGDLVDAVILRDFVGAPEGATPEELLLGLGEAWPPPWTLCRPRSPAHADTIAALDEEGRRKLGLAPSGEEKEAWIVDNIEYLAAGLEPAAWFERKGYGVCEPLGTLLEGGRLKPPKDVREDPAPSSPAPVEAEPAEPAAAERAR